MEAQAAAHLVLVQRLRADLADRDSELNEKANCLRGMETEHKVVTNQHRDTASKLEEARSRTLEAEKALDDAQCKTEKWRKTASDQAALIEKLMVHAE